MNPVIVTFGAGACAMAGGARTPRTATRVTASTNSLLITASSKRVSCSNVLLCRQRPTATTEADCGAQVRYTGPWFETSSKNYISGRDLTSIPQGLEALDGRPAEGRLGSDLAGPAKEGLRLVLALLGGQYQPEIVVGRLEVGVDAEGEAQRVLGLAVAAEMEQGQTQILMGVVRHGQGRLSDCLAVRGDGAVPLSRFGQRRTEVEIGVAAVRIEIHRFLQFGHRLIDAAEIEQQHTERVVVERHPGIEAGRFLKRGHRERRLALVDLVERPLVGVLRLQALHLGDAAGRAGGQQAAERQDEAKRAFR